MCPRLLELGPEVLRAPGHQTRKHHLCCREHAPTTTDCHSSYDETTSDPEDSTDQQSTGLSLSNPVPGENLTLTTRPSSSETTHPRSKSKNRQKVLTDKLKSYKNFPLLGLGVQNTSKECGGNPLPIKEPTVSQSVIPSRQNFHSQENSENSHCALNDPSSPEMPETLALSHLKSPKSRKNYQQQNHNSPVKKSSRLVREPKRRRFYQRRKKFAHCTPSVRATQEKSPSTLIISSSGTTHPRSKSKNRRKVLTDKLKSYKNFPLLGLGVKNMIKEQDGNPLPIKESTVPQPVIPSHQNFHSQENLENSHCALNDPSSPEMPETLALSHLKSPKSRKTNQQKNHNSLTKKSSRLVREPKHRRFYHRRKKCAHCTPSVGATQEKSPSTLIISSSGTTHPRSKSKNRRKVLTDKLKSYTNFPLLGLGVKNMIKEQDGNPLPIKEPTVSQSLISSPVTHSQENSEYSPCALNDPVSPEKPETLTLSLLKSPKSGKTYQQQNPRLLIKKSSCLVKEPKHRRFNQRRKKCPLCSLSVKATREKPHSTLVIPSSGDGFPVVKKHDPDPLLIEDPKYLQSVPLKDSRSNESIQSPDSTEDSDDLESSRFVSKPGESWKQGQDQLATQQVKRKGNSHPVPEHEEMFSMDEAWGNAHDRSRRDSVSTQEQYSDNFFPDKCHPDMQQGQHSVQVEEQEYSRNVHFADVHSQGQDPPITKDANLELRGNLRVTDFGQNQLVLLKQEDYPELAEQQSHKEGNPTSSFEKRPENQKAVEIKQHHRLFNLETKKWVIQKQNSKLNKFYEKKKRSSLPRRDKQDKQALLESYFSELLGENTELVLRKTPRKELFEREFAGYQLDLPVVTCLVEKLPGAGNSSCPREQTEVCIERDCQIEVLQSQVNQLEELVYKLMQRQQDNERDNVRRILDLHKTVFLANPSYTKTNRLKSPPQVEPK